MIDITTVLKLNIQKNLKSKSNNILLLDGKIIDAISINIPAEIYLDNKKGERLSINDDSIEIVANGVNLNLTFESKEINFFDKWQKENITAEYKKDVLKPFYFSYHYRKNLISIISPVCFILGIHHNDDETFNVSLNLDYMKLTTNIKSLIKSI